MDKIDLDLQTAKKKYEEAREDERGRLAGFLAKYIAGNEDIKDELRVVYGGRAGKGLKKYTSGRRMEEYDLSNWKWVEITDDNDFDCIVSLNMPDVDPRSGNSHVLFDRVGLLVSYHKDGHYYETAVCTDINLPLGDTDKDKIARLVIEQYKEFKKKKGV